MNDILFVILLISSGQGIFLFLLLIYRKRKRSVNFFLALIFLAFALQLFDMAMIFSKRILDFPFLAFFGMPFNLAIGPAIYFYVKRNKLKPDGKFRLAQALHFLPAILHLLYIFIIYHAKSNDFQREFLADLFVLLQNESNYPSTLSSLVFPALIYLQISFYLIKTNLTLNRRTEYHPDMYLWLMRIWWGVLVIGAFGLLQIILLVLGINQQPITGYVGALLGISYIYYGALIAFNQSPLFFGMTMKYRYSQLTHEATIQINDRLISHMEDNQAFRDPELSLNILSVQLNIPKKHLSQVINQLHSTNFRGFVNRFRVEEMKSQMENPDNDSLSLLGIALQCGFNSKSTYQEAFKKALGQSPTEYLKLIRKK